MNKVYYVREVNGDKVILEYDSFPTPENLKEDWDKLFVNATFVGQSSNHVCQWKNPETGNFCGKPVSEVAAQVCEERRRYNQENKIKIDPYTTMKGAQKYYCEECLKKVEKKR